MPAQPIMEKYDSECQEYFNRIYPGISRILSEGRATYSRYIDYLYHLHLFQNYLLEDEKKYFKKKPITCLSTFYAKAASDAICLYQCLNQGQIISSMAIERNIFESMVNLKLILTQDTPDRIKLYEEFGYVLLWNRIDEYKKYLNSINANPELTDEFKQEEKERFNKLFNEELINITVENFAKVKDNYLEGRPFHWAWKIFKDELKQGRNPSVYFICKKLGIENMYRDFYSLNSVVVHSEPLMSEVLIQHGGISSAPNFSDPIKNIAASSSTFISDIILMILNYAKSPKYEEIKIYLSEKWITIY
jgi:hypothetical protein